MVAGVLFAVVGKVNGPVTERRPFNTSCVAPNMTDWMAGSVMGCAGALANVIFPCSAAASCTVDWLPAMAVRVTLLFVGSPVYR